MAKRKNKKWSKILSEKMSKFGKKLKKMMRKLVPKAPKKTELKPDPDLPLTPEFKPKPYNNENRKSWVEEKTGLNCFMLYANELAITWVQDENYWYCYKLDETSDTGVPVAELLDVCWLDVHGKIDISEFSPNTIYEILFIVMVTEEASGFRKPVSIRIIPPDEEPKEYQESLYTKPRGEWIEIKAGEFLSSPDKTGEIHFSLFEHGGHWKSGLIVEGALIRPKKQA